MRNANMASSEFNRNSASSNPHLNGAALVGADGREVPITEEMICAALEALADDDLYARQGHYQAGRHD